MHIERQYRELEKIEEIRVYNVDSSKFYQEAPQVMKPDKVETCSCRYRCIFTS